MGSFYSRYLNLFASDQGGYGTIDNIKFQITLNMSQHNIERLRLLYGNKFIGSQVFSCLIDAIRTFLYFNKQFNALLLPSNQLL